MIMAYGYKDTDGIEETNYTPISKYKCVRCKRDYKCRNSTQSSGCPVCDAARMGGARA